MSTWWERIRNSKCELCPLHKETNRVCSVTGRGWIHSKVMFVGEAPGEAEERRGLPFVGPSGRLLLELIQESGFTSTYSVTNAVCCRPDGNRTPKTAEWKVCAAEYLRRTIHKQRPQLIICLGATALKAVMSDSKLKLKDARRRTFVLEVQMRGKGRGTDTTPRFRKIKVMCTYHPAAVLRDPTKRGVVLEDFRQFTRVLAGEAIEEDPKDRVYVWQDAGEDLPAHLTTGHAMALDLETSCFSPFEPNARIIACATSQAPLHAHAFLFPGGESQRALLQRALLRRDTVKIGHNVKYDLLWLKKNGFKISGSLFDTHVAMHLLDENYPDRSLEHLAALFTPMGHYAGDVKQQRFKPGFMEALFRDDPEKGFHYVCSDADATYRLQVLFEHRLHTEGLLPPFRLLMRTIRTLLDVELAGVYVDTDALDLQARETEKHIRQVSTWLERNWPGLNYRSPKQIARLVFETFKIRPGRYNKQTKQPSTDEEALRSAHARAKNAHQQKTIRAVQELRKWTKIMGTYIEPMRDKHIMPDGYVHPTYNVVGAKSRLSCSRPNWQNIPAEFRKVFTTRFGDDGYIVQADGSQMELRVLAHYCKEPKLLDAFENDRDVHRETAAEVFGKPTEDVTKEERDLAKRTNFLTIYGGRARRLAAVAKIPLPDAERFLERYFARLPHVRRWIHKIRRECILYGEVSSLFGRIRRLPITDPDSPAGQHMLRQAVNFPIQDSASSLTLLIMNSIHDMLRRGMRSKIIGTVHDSVVLDCPKDEVEEVMLAIEELWENPNTTPWGFELDVPLKVDISYGPSWGELKEMPNGA